ncbi:uncharacterized protein N7484_008472 [Penicillium longicatenatum]|uniref:uncharacterized protein n=1 Tax=Penicillium longicatenatum TaxID=1561947 RepID=UPI0025493402|nr:uncharacterized protein N7484_008472 [Penicillium longicatenatum]KAJ5635159.1 hypothetical protein N7484_008472 [Penicillium longicatenatum]
MPEQEQPQIKVLTTPELLEIILLHLDTRTLLVSAQRVCQTWTALIQSSPAIQQALFFRPFTPKPKKDKWHAESIWNYVLPSPFKKDTKLDQGSINECKISHTRPIYNPLLVQAFRPFFPSVHEYPFIHDNEGKVTETEHEGKEKKKNTFSFKTLDMLSSPQKKSAYMRKEASWRKMLLRQPPNPDLYFGRFGQTRVYWSAYVPPCESYPDARGGHFYPPEDGSHYPRVKKAFAKAIEKSEVVVFSREVIQCCVGGERELTEEENLREEIAEAEAGGFKGVEKLGR